MKVNLNRLESVDRCRGVIADVKSDDMANGLGVRVTVFTGYCPLNCYNCFNKKIQSYNFGVKEAEKNNSKFPMFYSKKVEDYIINLLKKDYISGLTLLGGEPFLNTKSFLPLCRRFRKEFGDTKNIWSWTGFEWEELQEAVKLDFPLSRDQREMLNLIDVLIDGRYVDSIRNLDKTRNKYDIHFRGSSNQRIIDVPSSLKTGKVVERKDIYKDDINVKRVGDFKKLTGKESVEELIKKGY